MKTEEQTEWCDVCNATVDVVIVKKWLTCDNCNTPLFEAGN